MIAIDTNLLVYAHREDSEWHKQALRCIQELAESGQRWAIPWPCVHEFLAITTHPKIYLPPTSSPVAISSMEAWQQSPGLELLHEGAAYWDCLRKLITSGRIKGPRVHDARVAAICISNGVKTLWSADRDFSRFKELRTHNPLAG